MQERRKTHVRKETRVARHCWARKGLSFKAVQRKVGEEAGLPCRQASLNITYLRGLRPLLAAMRILKALSLMKPAASF